MLHASGVLITSVTKNKKIIQSCFSINCLSHSKFVRTMFQWLLLKSAFGKSKHVISCSYKRKTLLHLEYYVVVQVFWKEPTFSHRQQSILTQVNCLAVFSHLNFLFWINIENGSQYHRHQNECQVTFRARPDGRRGLG